MAEVVDSKQTLVLTPQWGNPRLKILQWLYFLIADAQSSPAATDISLSLPTYQDPEVVSIPPNDYILEMRHRAGKEGKTLLVVACGIKTAFLLLSYWRG
jgi:hypothetical protein